MKKLFGFSVVFTAALLVLGGYVEAERVQHGSLVKARGVVQYRAAGSAQWVTASERMAIDQGDRLKTGINGEAVIRISNRNFISISPNSEITINLSSVHSENEAGGAFGMFGARHDVQKIETSLDRGRAINVLKGLGRNSEYNLHTPVAVAGVRGTVFSAELVDRGHKAREKAASTPAAMSGDNLAAQFTCSEGEVMIGPNAPGAFDPVSLGPGQTITLTPGAATPSNSDVTPAAPAVLIEMFSEKKEIQESGGDFSTGSTKQDQKNAEITSQNAVCNY